MIPARLGSQRLKQKNLRALGDIPLLTRAVRKCKKAGCFDKIFVNTESDVLGKIALEENVCYHKRPPELANNRTTSEQFVYEFLKNHNCDYIVQVHSIAPLLSLKEVSDFVNFLSVKQPDVLLSAVEEQIECTLNGKPVNFTFKEKTNSQELTPVQRITWSITAWKRSTFISAYENDLTATYAGAAEIFPIARIAGHIIKTEEDLQIAECLLPLVQD